jgi:DNA-binding response OmpR family regulator
VTGSPALSLAIVDDDVRTVQRLAQLLRDDGFRVYTAHNVGEAERLAATNSFEVALIDVRLPDGDGREVARRWLARFPALEVVYVTIYKELFARAPEGSRESALTKPIDYAALVAALRAREATLPTSARA